ncbi:uncharacterized protein LOC121635652 [Melanotaenia boesemani]|uniref:uncharacterized protein LOC121635652 n=1 Tax=Melanotaenia boesemani TaxID=1250792 RepID=UPI001C0518F9|nr:uncharacterized protein LOC121635652 [Melanotaenia boesemani]
MCSSCQETNGVCVTRYHHHLYFCSRPCSAGVSDGQREGMNFTTNPDLVPDRDSLPLKKRDQRLSSPLQQQLQKQQQCDTASFKEPYPYKNHSEFKAKHVGPFRPVPRRVPALYQPWIQTNTLTKPKQHIPSAFKEHHGWVEWREFNTLSSGWDFPHHYQHQNHLSSTHALHPGHPHYSSRFSAVSLFGDSFHRGSGGWENLQTLRDKSLNPDRQIYGKHKSPYVRRGDKKVDHLVRAGKSSPPLLSTRLPLSPHQDITLQPNSPHKSAKAVSVPGHFPLKATPNNPNSAYMTMTKDQSRYHGVSSSEHASSSSSSPNHFPWLLPHFVAGSLIELRDGRLRKVEHLQTEDFLLGSLACPDLRLSCCTVQSISPSSSSSSISRLLILLHDQQSQELVDVYVEYPFFVRGQGWSSCSPQRTAHLCGLQCRQLTVGDICLALTPVSAPKSPLTAPLKPNTSPRKSEGGCKKSQKAQTALYSKAPLELKQKMGTEAMRRRHYSAP